MNDKLVRFLQFYAAMNKGKLFTAEDVTSDANVFGLDPDDPRQWGPVFISAKKSGLIRNAKAAGRPIYVPRYNGSPQPIYTC